MCVWAHRQRAVNPARTGRQQRQRKAGVVGPSFFVLLSCTTLGCASQTESQTTAVPTVQVASSSAAVTTSAPTSSAAPAVPTDARERDVPLSTPRGQVPGWVRPHEAALSRSARDGQRTPAPAEWQRHAEHAFAQALTGVAAYKPDEEPALAVRIEVDVAADGSVSDGAVTSESGTLLDLVALEAFLRPFPTLSQEAARLDISVRCRSKRWPQTAGGAIAVASGAGCTVDHVARIGGVGVRPPKISPRKP